MDRITLGGEGDVKAENREREGEIRSKVEQQLWVEDEG